MAKIDALHTVLSPVNAREHSFRGLDGRLFLAKGARVFLNNNLNTEIGLSNEAMGEVSHIEWADGGRPPNLPRAVFVRFAVYRGRQYFSPKQL